MAVYIENGKRARWILFLPYSVTPHGDNKRFISL
jgi:hypothetical protein